jgi:glycerophosphoryl diester phosphodiesterase
MWPYPRILGHRGGGKLAPENTMAGFRLALSMGFRGVEFDVALSRDGVPVVMHDPHLGRTVAGSGSVFDFDAAELTRLDAGSWFGKAYEAETVPLFTAVASFCKQHGVWMNVEIKPAPGHDVATGRVVAELTRSMFGAEIAAGHLPAIPLLSSFSMAALEAAQTAAPDVPRACLFDVIPPDWKQIATRLGAVAIHTNQKNLTPDMVKSIKAAGFGMFCYTVNEPVRAQEIFGWGVDGLCTDRLDLIGP